MALIIQFWWFFFQSYVFGPKKHDGDLQLYFSRTENPDFHCYVLFALFFLLTSNFIGSNYPILMNFFSILCIWTKKHDDDLQLYFSWSEKSDFDCYVLFCPIFYLQVTSSICTEKLMILVPKPGKVVFRALQSDAFVSK